MSEASHAFAITDRCPQCAQPLKLRHRRADGRPFVSCSGYPSCRFSSGFDATVDALARTVDDLKVALDRAMRRPPPTPLPAEITGADIKKLIFAWHPDRNPGGLDPTTVVAELNLLRARVAA